MADWDQADKVQIARQVFEVMRASLAPDRARALEIWLAQIEKAGELRAADVCGAVAASGGTSDLQAQIAALLARGDRQGLALLAGQFLAQVENASERAALEALFRQMGLPLPGDTAGSSGQ